MREKDNESNKRKELYAKLALASVAGSGMAYFATRKLPKMVIQRAAQHVDDVPVQQAVKQAPKKMSILDEMNQFKPK